MQKSHELTNILWNDSSSKDDLDNKVRSFLKDKAKKISGEMLQYTYAHDRERVLCDFLGLTPPEPEFRTNGDDRPVTYSGPSGGKEWCPHLVWDMDRWMWKSPKGVAYHTADDDWLVCPICAAPRPAPPSIEEELEIVLEKADLYIGENPYGNMAKAALAFLKERGVMK